MINLYQALLALLGILGTSLAAHLTTILYGRIGRMLFIAPFEWIARKTRTTKDDKLVETAKEDLGISPKKQEDK